MERSNSERQQEALGMQNLMEESPPQVRRPIGGDLQAQESIVLKEIREMKVATQANFEALSSQMTTRMEA